MFFLNCLFVVLRILTTLPQDIKEDQVSPDKHYSQILPIPMTSVRKTFLNVDAKYVSIMRFYGDDFGCYEDHPIVIADTVLINKFLNALRHATGRRNPVLDYLDDVEVHFKPQGRTVRQPVHLQYLAAIEIDSFGAEYRNALKALSLYQAAHP